jgi:hypothetical protein
LQQVETSRDKKNDAHQDSADATDHRDGTTTGNLIQVCLIAVDYDQGAKDREADSQADKADSGSDFLECLLFKQPAGHFGFRL